MLAAATTGEPTGLAAAENSIRPELFRGETRAQWRQSNGKHEHTPRAVPVICRGVSSSPACLLLPVRCLLRCAPVISDVRGVG